MKHKNILLPLFIGVVCILIFIWPILKTGATLGDGIDHDIEYMYHAGFFESLSYGQIPFWNPWHCGGNFLWAHPQMELLSPLSLPIWLLGPALGYKLRIFLALLLAFFGAYFLGRELGLKKYSALIPGFLYVFNGAISQQQVAGQSFKLAYAFFPLILLFYLRTIKNKEQLIKNYLLFIVLLAFQSFDNTAYYFMYTLMFLGLLTLIYSYEYKSLRPIKIFGITLIIVFCLLGVRAVPMLEIYEEFPRKIEKLTDKDGIALHNMLKIFTYDVHSEEGWEWYYRLNPEDEFWYEYSYYIGWFALLLALIGLPLLWKKQKALSIVGIFFFLFSLGVHSPIPVFKFVHLFPVFSSQHMPNRAFIYVMLLLGLSLGYVLSYFEKRKLLVHKINISKFFVFGGIIIVGFILITTNSKAFEKGFNLPLPDEIDQPFQIVSNYNDFHWNFRNYQNMRENRAVISCNVEPLHPANDGIIPSYYIVEREYMKANFNHRPIFVFDRGVQSYWLNQDVIQDLSQLSFRDSSKTVPVIFFFPDQENSYPTHPSLPGNPQAKLVLPTWNLVKIALDFDQRSKVYSREDINFSQVKESVYDFSLRKNDETSYLLQTSEFFIIIQDTTLPDKASGKITLTELDRPFYIRPNPAYKGEVYLLEGPGKAEVIDWSPNEVTVQVNGVQGEDVLVLNQNYFKGWYEKHSGIDAIDIEHKVGIRVNKGGVYVFKYYAPGFSIGIILSLITILLIFIGVRTKILLKFLR